MNCSVDRGHEHARYAKLRCGVWFDVHIGEGQLRREKDILPITGRVREEATRVELRATRPFRIVDAFTAQPYLGKPAVVLVLDAAVDATWMQVVAMEFNLAETAFVQ